MDTVRPYRDRATGQPLYIHLPCGLTVPVPGSHTHNLNDPTKGLKCLRCRRAGNPYTGSWALVLAAQPIRETR